MNGILAGTAGRRDNRLERRKERKRKGKKEKREEEEDEETGWPSLRWGRSGEYSSVSVSVSPRRPSTCISESLCSSSAGSSGEFVHWKKKSVGRLRRLLYSVVCVCFPASPSVCLASPQFRHSRVTPRVALSARHRHRHSPSSTFQYRSSQTVHRGSPPLQSGPSLFQDSSRRISAPLQCPRGGVPL